MLTRESFRLRFLGIICLFVFIGSLILGMALSALPDFALDLTRTAICCQSTTEALIIATQTGEVVQTELADISSTQTHIAQVELTIESQLSSYIATPTPR